MSEAKYRPNVAVIVTDGHGRVLLCERADEKYAGRLQTVQGGIDPGEDPQVAAEREMREELGLRQDEYRVIGVMEEKFRYDWTEEYRLRVKSDFVGQEQQYFLVEVSPDASFDLAATHREFSRVAWGSPAELVERSWEGKRPGIMAALRTFGLLEVVEQSA